jgi:pimeloyl-ACP methyl ester carboxylesterase
MLFTISYQIREVKQVSKTQFEATLEDGSSIEIEAYGEGPTLLFPVNPRPIEGPQADEMQKYGADPALGQNLIKGLSDVVRVVAFDYEGHLRRKPRPETLTPANVVKDVLTIADATGTDHFAYYGYSWLALIGLQLAVRTNRLSALIMGGFPPIDGPYAEMLRVTTAAYEIAGGNPALDDEWSASQLTKDETKQYVTLYQALQFFDDRAVQAQITCPRLCFVGSADEIQYGKTWGDVFVSLAGPVVRGRSELEALGWHVRVLEGLDHMQAMQAAQVVPMLRSWLVAALRAA